MRTPLLIASGFVLCLILGVGIHVYQLVSHPLGAVTNQDYPLVQLANERGVIQHQLGKGESKLMLYGEYTVSIPAINASFVLFKNNRGTCIIRSANDVLLVQTNENAAIRPSPK